MALSQIFTFTSVNCLFILFLQLILDKISFDIMQLCGYQHYSCWCYDNAKYNRLLSKEKNNCVLSEGYINITFLLHESCQHSSLRFQVCPCPCPFVSLVYIWKTDYEKSFLYCTGVPLDMPSVFWLYSRNINIKFNVIHFDNCLQHMWCEEVHTKFKHLTLSLYLILCEIL